MIGLILVTHGQLAQEFVSAMEHVVGPQAAIESVCIGPQDDAQGRREEISEKIAEVDQGQGVIILTDLLEEGKVEVIAGINLPMLIRLARARTEMDVADAVRAARDAGRNYITIASEFLARPSEEIKGADK